MKQHEPQSCVCQSKADWVTGTGQPIPYVNPSSTTTKLEWLLLHAAASLLLHKWKRRHSGSEVHILDACRNYLRPMKGFFFVLCYFIFFFQRNRWSEWHNPGSQWRSLEIRPRSSARGVITLSIRISMTLSDLNNAKTKWRCRPWSLLYGCFNTVANMSTNKNTSPTVHVRPSLTCLEARLRKLFILIHC